MSEVWVNIGYRLSASHKPKLNGFKDQWLALQWIKANIKSFGGGFPFRDSIYMGTSLLLQEILITYKSKAILQVRISNIKYHSSNSFL